MSDRPILFSGMMVRALLADQKTKTRRLVKPQPKDNPSYGPLISLNRGTAEFSFGRNDIGPHRGWWRCPYGQFGDTLIVRETTRFPGEFDHLKPSIIPERGQAMVHYVADGPADGYGKRRPAIHMPRWACRIRLQVVDVCVERLQSITEADAVAEGITAMETEQLPGHIMTSFHYPSGPDEGFVTAIAAYRHLWEHLNGSESWAANPWVWCISFTRI